MTVFLFLLRSEKSLPVIQRLGLAAWCLSLQVQNKKNTFLKRRFVCGGSTLQITVPLPLRSSDPGYEVSA